jgi:hypothetical protein
MFVFRGASHEFTASIDSQLSQYAEETLIIRPDSEPSASFVQDRVQPNQDHYKKPGAPYGGPHPSSVSKGENGGVSGPPKTEITKMNPEIRKYKRKFNSEILCGALWGVNLLVGTDNGLLLLDRSGHGKVFQLISRRKFSQIDVLEGLNVLIGINGRKNKLRIYYLSWLRQKILKGDEFDSHHTRQGFVPVGDVEHCIHYKVARTDKMKFLVIGTKTNVEVYAWAQKPYSKFMAFKSFTDLPNRPLLVDMIHLPGGKSKVIYASTSGFHSVDLETGVIQNIYVPVAAVRER